MRIDRNRVAQSFHRQAYEYERHATVQGRVTRQLLSMVYNHVQDAPSAILDVGCGTGRLLAELYETYPDTSLSGIDIAENMVAHTSAKLGNKVNVVVGDAELIPFPDMAFDLVVSSSTLQWLDTLDNFLDQAYRVLDDNGLLCCAFFGGITLHEVQQCYRDVIGKRNGEHDSRIERLHRFATMAEVQQALLNSSFSEVVLTSEKEVEYYKNLNDLLRSIQKVGAGTSPHNGNSSRGGLGWRGILHEMSDLYRERFGDEGKVPATYEVFYVIARKISLMKQ